jgi:hypothetical protein
VVTRASLANEAVLWTFGLPDSRPGWLFNVMKRVGSLGDRDLAWPGF